MRNAFTTSAARECTTAISVVTDLMFLDYPEHSYTPICLVLGSGIATPFVIREAVKLFHKEYFHHMMLCGGNEINTMPETAFFAPHIVPLLKAEGLPVPKDGQTEVDYMIEHLETRAIPHDKYSFENESTNTEENFLNIQKLRAWRQSNSVRILGLLTTRAVATLRKLEKEAGATPKTKVKPKIVTATNVIPFPGVTRDNWHRHEIAALFICDEYEKLQKYTDLGFCEKIDPRKEINDALKLPSALLFAPESALRNRFYSRARANLHHRLPPKI